MRYNPFMSRTWELLLAINSAFWTFCLGFLTYAFCMLFVALEWQQFLLALTMFVAATIAELIMSTVLS